MLTDMTWVMASALLVSMVLAAALGANDVGNFFGTSVGANILTMKSAFFLATVFEIAGAVSLGERVSDTIWKNIIDYRVFKDQEKCLMLGNLSALIGCSLWMLIATRFRLPVSATHSVVGATVGYAMVVHGSRGVNWHVFVTILASWLASPVLAGVLSLLLFYLLRKFLSSAAQPAMVVLKWLPITCAITVMVNVFSILLYGPETGLSVWYLILITLALGAIVALIVWFLMVPRLKRKVRLLEDKTRSGLLDDSEESLDDVKASGGPVSSEKKVEMYIDNYVRLKDKNDSSLRGHEPGAGQRDGETSLLSLNSVGIQVYLPQDTSRHVTLPNQHFSESFDEQGIVRSGPFEDFGPNDPVGGGRYDQSRPQTATSHRHSEFAPLLNARPTNTQRSEIVYQRQALQTMHTQDVSLSRTSVHDSGDLEPYLSIQTIEMNRDAEIGSSPSARIKPVLYDRPSVAKIFSVLQIMSALFGSFTHGFNDVSNAIAPLVAAWMLWVTELNFMSAKTPLWILLYGGTFIGVGIWLWGDRTIKTIGQDITSICPSTGFVIEICSAIAVLIASNLGLPVSSTHCKVGSVVCVGRMSGRDAVNWKLVRNIAIAWAVTFPVTGIISAAVMTALRKLVPM